MIAHWIITLATSTYLPRLTHLLLPRFARPSTFSLLLYSKSNPPLDEEGTMNSFGTSNRFDSPANFFRFMFCSVASSSSFIIFCTGRDGIFLNSIAFAKFSLYSSSHTISKPERRFLPTISSMQSNSSKCDGESSDRLSSNAEHFFSTLGGRAMKEMSSSSSISTVSSTSISVAGIGGTSTSTSSSSSSSFVLSFFCCMAWSLSALKNLTPKYLLCAATAFSRICFAFSCICCFCSRLFCSISRLFCFPINI
mmetsp:Transcript_10029/g.16435  ORF Transcript_10029/g.16435 Transcript_10029/m.16435 type:complete len:252 (+) Transcript_10029:154-909(+)